MIRHSVILQLKPTLGADAVAEFFLEANKLAAIPGVQRFECLKQVSPKNKFEYGISMEFATKEQYDAYTNHPYHVAFVQQQWLTCVEAFLEIDYVPFGIDQ
jgi:heme-degrading monooxygenase HmoA